LPPGPWSSTGGIPSPDPLLLLHCTNQRQKTSATFKHLLGLTLDAIVQHDYVAIAIIRQRTQFKRPDLGQIQYWTNVVITAQGLNVVAQQSRPTVYATEIYFLFVCHAMSTNLWDYT